jgi:hypothetical protein
MTTVDKTNEPTGWVVGELLDVARVCLERSSQRAATFMRAVRVGSSLSLNGRMAAPTAGASSDSAARDTGAMAGTLAEKECNF